MGLQTVFFWSGGCSAGLISVMMRRNTASILSHENSFSLWLGI
jgi:hypothetical protein